MNELFVGYKMRFSVLITTENIIAQVLRHKITQESGVSKLEWKGKTPFLFSAGLDGVLRCYDARTAQCVKSFTSHTEDILDLYISA